MKTLLLFALALLMWQYIAYQLGGLLTRRPLLRVRPLNCRPCLTFWISALGSVALHLVPLHLVPLCHKAVPVVVPLEGDVSGWLVLGMPAWLLIVAGWASAASAFALYLYTKSKYHVTD